ARRFAGDIHGVGKRRPRWLARLGQARGPRTGVVSFPAYPQRTVTTVPESMALEADPADIESYFATHRWLDCLAALLDPGLAPAAVTRCAAWLSAAPPRTDPAWEP